MKRFGVLAVVCVLIVVCGCSAGQKPVTAILGAFDLELEVLRQETVNQKVEKIMGLEFVTGELGGRNVVFVEGGIGKVQSAVATTLLIDHFKPSEVIFTGVAGGINPGLKGGDIVIAEKTAMHDLVKLNPGGWEQFDLPNVMGGELYPKSYASDVKLLGVAIKAAKSVELEQIGSHTPKVITGVIVSGDAFVSDSKKCDELRSYFKADAVEMEGAVVAQICYQQGVPWIVVRSVSDSADENADSDFVHNVDKAANNAAKIVVKMMELMAAK